MICKGKKRSDLERLKKGRIRKVEKSTDVERQKEKRLIWNDKKTPDLEK